jgi:hypothetical protein
LELKLKALILYENIKLSCNVLEILISCDDRTQNNNAADTMQACIIHGM